jgi:hypothetical protein
MPVAEQNAHLRCVTACAIIQNTLEQLRILNRPFGLWEKETGSLCVEVLQEKQEREREREMYIAAMRRTRQVVGF